MNAVSAGDGAAQADLLLHSRDTIDSCLKRPVVQEAQRLHDGPDADLVVQAGGGHEAVTHVTDAQSERHRVAGRDDSLGILAVAGTDVNPNVSELRHLVAFFIGEQVRGLARQDAGHRAVPRPDGQALAEQHLHVPATDGLHIQVAAIVHVLHHEGDLVAVTGKHDPRQSARVEDGNHVTVPVRAQLLGVGLSPGADPVLDGPLEAGSAGGEQKVFQEG
jgi:hypothetical protein